MVRCSGAALAAIFLLCGVGQAEARRHAAVPVTQFCDTRYCGFQAEPKRTRWHGRKAAHRVARKTGPKVRVAPEKRIPDALASIAQTFQSPIGAVCGAVNILQAFYRHVAQIVEPVRPGYVAIQAASGARAVVAKDAAPRFVAFIRALEATGYRIKEMGGYSYRRIAGTRTLSKHAFGRAIDINQLERDRVSVPMNRREVSRLASNAGLVSGGDWRHGDLGHFEMPSGQRQAKPRHVRYASVR